MAVLKIKPYGKDQGDFVLIDEENFDPSRHELLDSEKTFDEQVFSDDAHTQPITSDAQDSKPGKGRPKK